MPERDQTIQSWIDQAWYDWETARAMLESRRFLYVTFCCQQAAEKMLKALIADKSGQFPPRIHNLVRLAEHAGIPFDVDHVDLMRQLTDLYTQSRYPDQLGPVSADVWQPLATQILVKTEQLLKWLSSMTK